MRRILPIALLLVSLLAGCAAGEDATSQETPSVSQETPSDSQEATSAEEPSVVTFSTTDLDGNAWDEDALADNTLTMINFWEPWCGPCVSEMPDLQQLQTDYAAEGFAIWGVCSSEDEESIQAVIEDTGVTYPLLRYSEDFDRFQTGYVPTTIFVNAQGELVGEICIGAKSYEEWAALLEELL